MNKIAEQIVCGDCGVLEGEEHLYGCDQEECPFCGRQLIGCLCRYKLLGLYHPYKYKSTNGINTYEYSHALSQEQEEKWINILTSKGRIPFIQYPLICSKCGALWPNFFMVSDSEWIHYIPPSHQQDVICLNCYNSIKSTIDANNNTP